MAVCIGTCISIVTAIDCLHYSSLCQELNGLFRVLWSGRWAQVSPHGFLQAVWQRIPTFKGHAQQDAQEFLWYRSCCLCSVNFFDACVNIFIYMMKLVLDSEFVPFFSLLCFCSELIDKVQNEMHDLDLFDAVSDMFQGQLVSQVICKKFWCMWYQSYFVLFSRYLQNKLKPDALKNTP